MCECKERVNEQLKDRGVQLEQLFGLGTGAIGEFLVLHTVKIETLKPAKPKIFLSFCPFCGVKYESQNTEKREAV